MQVRIFVLWFFCLIFSSTSILGWVFEVPPTIYNEIQDCKHPTFGDYRIVQRYLTNGHRPKLDRLYDRTSNGDNYVQIVRGFKIIGDTPAEFPSRSLVSVNCPDEDRENCIIMYTSFNKRYPDGLKRLVSAIKQSDFRGHMLYYFGGWPNVEAGDLSLAHVPYSFKACLFKEAERLGFKKVLWLDSATLPVVSLNNVFDMIAEKGCFFVGNVHMIGPHFNEEAAGAFGITLSDSFHIPSCCSAQVGIDFSNPKAAHVIEQWYDAAKDCDAYYSPLHDQNALSIILYQEGISDFIDYRRIVDTYVRSTIAPDSVFILDKMFVHGKKSPLDLRSSPSQKKRGLKRK